MTTAQSSKFLSVRCVANFKSTGQQCDAFALTGKKTCARHGALSTGPRTPEGRKLCSQARIIHGQQTTTMRTERSLASARLALLEEIGHEIKMMSGPRTRGRRPGRMTEAFPELRALLPQELLTARAKHST